jgi:hypothetical protein
LYTDILSHLKKLNNARQYALNKFRDVFKRSEYNKGYVYNGDDFNDIKTDADDHKLIENCGCIDKVIDIDWCIGFLISLVPLILFTFLIFKNDLELINFNYGPTKRMLEIINGFKSHAHLTAHAHRSGDHVRDSLCGLVGKIIEEITSFAVTEIESLVSQLAIKLEKFILSVKLFDDILDTVEDGGKVILNVFTVSWRIMEKLLVLIIPILNSVLFLIGAFVNGVKSREGDNDEKENLNLLSNTISRLICILAIYNIVSILMLEQLMGTIKNINLFIFYFEVDIGLMSSYSIISSGANLLGLGAIYVSTMYPLR